MLYQSIDLLLPRVDVVGLELRKFVMVEKLLEILHAPAAAGGDDFAEDLIELLCDEAMV